MVSPHVRLFPHNISENPSYSLPSTTRCTFAFEPVQAKKSELAWLSSAWWKVQNPSPCHTELFVFVMFFSPFCMEIFLLPSNKQYFPYLEVSQTPVLCLLSKIHEYSNTIKSTFVIYRFLRQRLALQWRQTIKYTERTCLIEDIKNISSPRLLYWNLNFEVFLHVLRSHSSCSIITSAGVVQENLHNLDSCCIFILFLVDI